MKRILKVAWGISLLIFTFRPTYSQGWQWQNPLPFGDPITQVFFVDKQYGWMTPKNRTLLRTTDGGENWEILPVGIFFEDIHFITALEGWGIGREEIVPENRNNIYHTKDGGLTWEIQLADTTVEHDIFFVDRYHGWATGPSTILRTRDGGKTWIRQGDEAFRISGDNILGITFIDTLKGWAVGGLIFGLHTEDGGKTWQRDSTLYSRQKVIYTDSLHLWALSRGRLVSRTIDGGKTWEEFTITDTTLEVRSQDIFALDSNRVFVSTNIGVFASENGGQTWRIHSEQAMLSFVFLDSLEVWGGGIDNLFPGLLHSSDGGKSWENIIKSVVPHGFENFVAVDFVDAQTGWIIGNIAPRGSGNFILKTTDGGKTWTKQESNSNQRLTNLAFLDRQTGWIVGFNGTVLHTTDGGQNWVKQTTGTPFALQAIDFVDRNNGWAVGGGFIDKVQGVILHSKDGGYTWIEQTPEGVKGLLDVCFVDSLNGWVVGGGGSELDSGIILRTRDGGNTWITQRTTQYEGWWKVEFVDTIHGWAIGYDPHLDASIIYTEDGGETWRALNRELFFSDIIFLDTQYGWGVGDNGMIFHTRNGGQSWVRQPTYAGKPLWDVDFVDRLRGWAVGDQGTILHTSTGGVTSISERFSNSAINENFILYANYPNPFNLSTKIRFDALKSKAAIRLTILDILGREVTMLFEGEVVSGTYEFLWNGTDKNGREVSSGIYFYRLEIDDIAVQTKKMLLLR